MRTNDEIIQIIKFENSKKGYTLTELAKQVGMAKSGISMIFNKTRQFPVKKVSDFAKALDVTPEYILGFDLHGNKVDDPQHTSNPLTADPRWEPSLTKKDEQSIEEKLEEIRLGISDGANAANNGLGLHEYSEETQKAVMNAIEIALHAMTLERKERFTPNKHKQVKGG